MNHSTDYEPAVYWLWLQQKLGFASRTTRRILEQPGGARFIYERSEDDLWALGLFKPGIIERLGDKSLDSAEKVLESCDRLGLRMFTPETRLYPKRLLELVDPPAVLFAKGDMPNIDQEPCIAVVGTRKASSFGAAMAQEIAGRLTDAGCLVVSGAARGIDTAAHQGALMCKDGRTIAVLGCGIDYPYNMQGADLRDVIAANGALVSEYPPGYPPSSHSFPIRNRIISGLSLGVIVVEAGMVSGSINTAYSALHQSRDVFTVAPSIFPANSDGIKRLLSEGAESIECPMDVLRHYSRDFAYKMNINESCSRRFMYGITWSSFEYSLSDVFGRFSHAFGYMPPGSAGAAANVPGTMPPVPPEYGEGLPGDYSSGHQDGERVISDDYLIENKAIIECEYESADRLVDKLLGEFIPSWRIPAPGGLPDTDIGNPGRVSAGAPQAQYPAVTTAPDDEVPALTDDDIRTYDDSRAAEDDDEAESFGSVLSDAPSPPDDEHDAFGTPPGDKYDAFGATPGGKHDAFGTTPGDEHDAFGTPLDEEHDAFGTPPDVEHDAFGTPPGDEHDAFGTPLDEELSEQARLLYGFIGSRPRSIDELASLSGISGPRLLSVLTELELFGLITAHSGKRYSRT